MNFDKVVILLHGVSGSGKSTFAEYIDKIYHKIRSAGISTDMPIVKFSIDIVERAPCICTADDYFMKNGIYDFKPELLGEAHKACQIKFEESLKNETPLVICANTNTQPKDYAFYIEKAKEYGYLLFSLVVQNLHGNTNVHNVPDVALQRQKDNIKNNLQL